MATFSSEEAEGKLLRKFHTPLKRKSTENEEEREVERPLSPRPVPLLPSAGEPSYLCQWRVPQFRKHKTWDGDAVLTLHGNKSTCSLRSIHDGSMIVTNAAFRKSDVQSGDELYVGGKEIVIERMLESSTDLFPSTLENNREKNSGPSVPRSRLVLQQRPIPSSQFYSVPKHSTPTNMTKQTDPSPLKMLQEPHPRYDPNAPGAVVMKRPSAKHQKIFGRGLPVVDVVLDPELSRILRPHQIEGVKFMYEAVTGMASVDYGHASTGQGAILADEMGLGKTLQTITLIMTLLRQSCYFSSVSSGTVEKVLIVCPLTLVVNWKREFRKWVGRSSVGLLAVEGDGRSEVERFVSGRQYQVLILGYERLRNCVNELAKAFPSIGLVVCDEGHRLKSKDTKTTKCFDLLPTRRRLLLTGTPIQNDLREFYTMVDFVYPGLFDQYSVFKRVFEDPIMRSRLQHCSEEALKLGRARNKALATVTKGIIIRRTADLLESYLPPKYEMMLFCTMSPIQLRIYGLCSEFVSNQLALGKGRNFLPYITLLRQLCNSPDLLRQDLSYIPRESESEVQALTRAVDTLLDQKSLCSSTSLANSGKMMVLHRLLTSIHRHTKDRVIIVSNYTSTLDMLQRYCVQQNFTTLRLDGRTKAGARSKLVQQFNKQADRSEAEPFVFLLSSKSGGVGLNLIGGNRLILFDSDWNPATDRQAMARIHRDGQKKPCYIYRMLLAGSMDEKIYQRQVTKIGLSDALMHTGADQDAEGTTGDSFTQEELRDIFNHHPDTRCLTHDLLGCPCNGSGVDPVNKDEPSNRSDAISSSIRPVGFISAAQVSSAMDYDKSQRRKLARQLTGLLHFDFGTHASSFPFDDMLQQTQIMEGEESTSTLVAPPDVLCADPTTCTKQPSDTVSDDALFLERLLTKYLRPSMIPVRMVGITRSSLMA